MTMLLILGAGIAAFAIFIAGCFVGHRTGRNEGSDSATRWGQAYADGDQAGKNDGWFTVDYPPRDVKFDYWEEVPKLVEVPPARKMKPKPKGPDTVLVGPSVRTTVDNATLHKMAAAHMERVMTEEGWGR